MAKHARTAKRKPGKKPKGFKPVKKKKPRK